MKIYESAVHKPITTILVFFTIIVFGVYSFSKLSIDLYPEIDPPMISVITFYPGANATDIETNVSRVLEDNLNTVNDLKRLTSTSKDNVSIIKVEFEWGIDMNEAANDVRDALDRVTKELPDGAEKPILFKFSTSMIPVIILSATANESYNSLYKILDDKIVNPLNRINGIGAVMLSGAPVREIQVNLDPLKLNAYNITIEQIGAAIGRENLDIPAGSMDIGSETIPVRIDGEYAESDELNDLVISYYDNKPILLKDLATVNDTVRKITLETSVNGIRGAQIVVQKQSGANSVNIVNDVLEEVEKLKTTLPPDITLNVILDTSDNIKRSINSLSDTVMYAFIFVMLVVMLFLGRWRATFIIVLTIPISLIAAFTYLYATGSTLNIISMSSLSIAIGMVVDDAIVVLENVTTHIQRGSAPKQAAIYGTNEVGISVVASTLTIIAVFFPLTFITGMAGVMFKQLGWIICIVVSISTFAALTLTPMLCSLMLRAQDKYSNSTFAKLYRPIQRGLDLIDNFYARALRYLLHHKTMTLIVAILIFISSMTLITKIGTDFFPATDNAQINMTVELPVGRGLDYTRVVGKKIDSIVMTKYPEIDVVSTSAGAADEDNLWASMRSTGSHIISYTLKMPPRSQRKRTIFEIGEGLREDLARIPEIQKYLVDPGGARSGGGMGGGGGSTIDIYVTGYNLNVTTKIADSLLPIIESVKGTRDVQIAQEELKPELTILFDRKKLAMHGLSTYTAASYVRNRINGLISTHYREDGDEYEIKVRYDEPFRKSVNELEDIIIYNDKGKGVKVREVGKVVDIYSPPTIERRDRQRVIKISASVEGASLGDVVNDLNAEFAKVDMPSDVFIEIGGTATDQQESFADLTILMILIIMLVYIVMASQFESFKDPFIIILSLPFSFTGVFLALWITNTSLSLIAFLGAIMLIGIVVKNGIVLIDYIKLMREREYKLYDAIVLSGKSRLRPVLMTTMTTILGMLPLAIGTGDGSETWQPMGIAVIGGLTFSTILTLVVIPVVFALFSKKNEVKE